MQKTWISAEQLLRDAITLGLRIVESGFRPDLVVGVWRGGTPVAIAVQEVLALAGIDCDHFPVRTRSYTGIGEQAPVAVDGLDYLERQLQGGESVLIVDDVFDTGRSIARLIEELDARFSPPLQIRVAVPWYKPGHNLTARQPEYHLHTTGDWLVFPHELAGLQAGELGQKPGLEDLAARLLALRPASV